MKLQLVEGRGHPNVRATHRTTFELTRESHLTPRGDCIIAVSADKAAADLDRSFVQELRGGWIWIGLVVGSRVEVVKARGSIDITSSNKVKLIVRRSTFIEPATVGVSADKAAADLDRSFVQELRGGKRLVALLAASQRALEYREFLGVLVDHFPPLGGTLG
ncbi:hypothetical protein HS1genome_0477 [Sulfodiicoccus acidiphilus]|uniref:DUF371 domain-containing protein n=1 Tax=Sulfodiicoccus acidiphilus TaxID=1670455 RepID=A0A348B1N6_9CREN|nr:DUF371 domain-containing protein [Sulfodiicoccus acidiphilus]BBD72088.1 hypothetical protein HS1genome_0477 [Sulfodiicoccus acidiphilus]GGU05064.1 hypothetical protein GCM10007116_21990 [Sulfodiicoccus acidiphilus]